jgi:hypothetical protein
MRLNAPTRIVFYISMVLIAFGMIAFFGNFLDEERVIAEVCTAGGGILLAAGCVFKGF